MLSRSRKAVIKLALIFALSTLVFSIVSRSLYAAPAGGANLYLPVILNGEPIHPVAGNCPAGMHLVHEFSGAGGIQAPDTEEYSDDDYICVVDESCDDMDPIAYGSCSELNGYAVYSCAKGYAGAECDVCAEGYVPNSAQDACVLAPPPRPPVKFTGFENSFEQGETRVLVASHPSANNFIWEITSGQGCFVDADTCVKSTSGATVLFEAPDTGDDIQMTEILVSPDCCTDPEVGTIITVVPDSIPVSGWGDADLEPIVRALRDFMVHRCVGAAMIGISYYGVPVGVWGLGRMEGAPAAVWDADCGNDPYLDAPPVTVDTPFSIGSISKSVTAAVTRWVLHQAILDETGQDLSDAEIEALYLFDDNPGIPFHFYPDGLYDLYSGQTTPPVILEDDPYYGESNTPLCETLTTQADEQWQEVTVAHLLTHKTGMQKRGTSFDAGFMPFIDDIRNLEDEDDFIAQEAQLRAIYGDAAVDAAKVSLGYTAGTDVYFVPDGTLEEYLVQHAGLCLRFPLGTHLYTNRSYLMAAPLIEELYGGLYMAAAGDPASHEGSALDAFFETVLGISTTGDSGIFRQQPAIEIPGYSYPGAVRRHWNGITYYPEGWDEKRPHCIWTDGSGCSLSAWTNENPGRINWDWQLDEVPFDRIGPGNSAAAGSIRTEAEVFLEFMSEFWVGGYTDTTPEGMPDPLIGEGRQNVWDFYMKHNGSTAGAYAEAQQLGSDGAPEYWLIPPVTPSGHITDDFENLISHSCSLPDGVDFIVAVNQNTDPNIIPGVFAYSIRLQNFIYYGICQVDWTHVMPTLPIIPPPP